MAKFFVPDSVAAEVHVREIPDRVIEGFPLAQQLALIEAFDTYNISKENVFEANYDSKTYDGTDGVGSLEVEDDRGHFYAYVFGADEAAAREEADAILAEWMGEEDEDDDD